MLSTTQIHVSVAATSFCNMHDEKSVDQKHLKKSEDHSLNANVKDIEMKYDSDTGDDQ